MPLHAMVAGKNENNLFANRFLGPGMNVRRILYNFQHVNALAARGLEEPCASFPDFCNNRQFHVIYCVSSGLCILC